uniref:Uncharacterized protein n=1 Tax=Anguilla anguilla TaxID=7936 RepID=A0A0E9VNF6_ANGAN
MHNHSDTKTNSIPSSKSKKDCEN